MNDHFDPELEEILQARRTNAVAAFIGSALIAVGWLMVGLCGLCSAAFVVAMIAEALRSGSGGDVVMFTTMVLFVGGIPIAVGAGLIWLGRRLRR
ncbi:MAG: hypothetical protein ACK4YQ_14530 [Phenylobacterium sp.]|uniref:hypothetical protein n=1 Tax=Phenylobacterium sp. TaxID=1871053 RepID=UPI003919E9F8